MPWYSWVVLAVVVAVIAFVLIRRAVRTTRRGRRFLGLSAADKIRVGRYLIADQSIPVVARAILVVTVGYLALPFDLIPDFVPVIGHFDDGIIVLVALVVLLRALPAERLDEALDAVVGREAGGTERPWTRSRRPLRPTAFSRRR